MTGRKGQQGNVAGALNRLGDLTLMGGTISGDSPRNNLPPLGNKIAEIANFLVIDFQAGVSTKATALTTGKTTPGSATTTRFSLKSHI